MDQRRAERDGRRRHHQGRALPAAPAGQRKAPAQAGTQGRSRGRLNEEYTILEIQQETHSADQEQDVELYGDGYTYRTIPLHEPLQSLDGDVIPLGEAGDVRSLEARTVAPWVWPDADGNYPDANYSMQALQATLTTAQGDACSPPWASAPGPRC